MKRLSVMFAVCAWSAYSAAQEPEGQQPPAEVKIERTADELAAIDQIRQGGALVLEVAQNDNRLDIGFHLQSGEVKDEHLAPLARITGVMQVNLRGTRITDAGLAHLAGLKSLERLHLEKTAVTDGGLEHLKGLENLAYLNLYGTVVTDAGLKHLTGLTKLQKLYLWESKVTDAGVGELKQALPNLQIVRGYEPAVKKEIPAEEPKPEEPKPEEPKKEEAKPEEKKEG